MSAEEFEQLRAEMRLEARDAIADKLAALSRLATAADPTADDEFRRQVHSLKGLAATFGFSGIAIIAHRLEDFLATAPALKGDVLIFLDRAQDALDGDDVAVMDVAEVVRQLPVSRDTAFDPADLEVRHIEIMLVAPPAAASRYVADELRACGYRLVSVPKAMEAIDFAVHSQPDLVIVSAVLDRFDGIDLICALKAMPSTRHIPVALVTSFEAGSLPLKDLPLDVPILHKSPTFADDVAAALGKLGII